MFKLNSVTRSHTTLTDDFDELRQCDTIAHIIAEILHGPRPRPLLELTVHPGHVRLQLLLQTEETKRLVNFTLAKKLMTTVIGTALGRPLNQLVTSLYNQKFGVVFHYWLIISNIFIKNFLEKKTIFQRNTMTEFWQGHFENSTVHPVLD